jgi:threonine dehydrogenase-like Zn-dependent dehydrogenase
MPSIETALSLVHDANPRYGESVVVFGQGLIGLLVTAILARSAAPMKDILSSACQGTITTVDTLPARLAASAQMGSHETLLPETLSSADHPRLFDVAIEVSGNSRALQAAIDSTRNGGKIIVGSWYGNADVALKLGIDFHRSHKLIQASQVCENLSCVVFPLLLDFTLKFLLLLIGIGKRYFRLFAPNLDKGETFCIELGARQTVKAIETADKTSFFR